jgi:hypothetical protein
MAVIGTILAYWRGIDITENAMLLVVEVKQEIERKITSCRVRNSQG